MDTNAQTLADLEKAEQAFSQAIGKHTIEQALELLIDLNLDANTQELIYSWIETVFERDAFAGYLRYDSIVQRIQIKKIQLQHRP